MKDRIVDLIATAIDELEDDLVAAKPRAVTDDVVLFGEDGLFDSLGLVTFIAEMEDLVADEFDAQLTLADDKAMSQRTSPFRTVGSFAAHVETVLGADA